MTETIDLVKSSSRCQAADATNPLKIGAYDTDQLRDDFLSRFDIVTFDCFDTILWRQVEKPTDAFYLLAQCPSFKKLGFSADLRMKCEEIARRRQWVRRGSREVNLTDIYRAFSENLSEAELKALINEEIDVEISICFPFKPVVDLIKRVRSLNKKVSIVSDTYLTAAQLRRLLSAHLGESLVNQLHEVIVSCELGVSKSDGLHLHSIKKHASERIFHIGDHDYADVKAANKAGLQAVHLIQYANPIKELMRLRTNALTLFDDGVRERTPIYNPYKTMLAKPQGYTSTAAARLGYAVLGPLMSAFAVDIQQRVDELSRLGKPIKVLFLLRDGHLPYEVYRALYPSANASPVRISRFASYAASFTDPASIENYLAEMIMGDRYEDMAKQLLFTGPECHQISNQLKGEKSPQTRFIKIILTKKNIDQIIMRSAQYRDRLMRYLQREAQVEKSDTLLLIDLGYSGTTQTKLSPIFKKAYDIDMLGHYLISLSTPGWRLARRGLLDPDVCDERSLQTLVTYVALLEQLCTTTDKSVVDFDEQGMPIYGDSNINQEQHDMLTCIQSEAIKFAKELDSTPLLVDNPTVRQQVAKAELGRLLFLPTPDEINLLKAFKFDLNLGTTDVFEMFDAEKGLNALRDRGMFFMEKNLKNMRTNYPAELRYANLPLLLTLVTQHRHGLSLTLNEMSFRRQAVTVIALKGDKSATEVLEAIPTFDGYFSLIVPVGKGDYFLGLSFGEQVKWLQCHSITLIPLHRWNTDQESLHSTDITSHRMLESMQDHGNGILQCESPRASLLIKPQETITDEIKIVRVVFRPLG